jgi:hypothetical protein
MQTCPAAHATPHAPQLVALVCRSTHDPAQSVSVVAHARHAPPTHAEPALQTVPHAPQFAASTLVFTHSAPQRVVPEGHGPVHAPLTQLCPAAHATVA